MYGLVSQEARLSAKERRQNTQLQAAHLQTRLSVVLAMAQVHTVCTFPDHEYSNSVMYYTKSRLKHTQTASQPSSQFGLASSLRLASTSLFAMRFNWSKTHGWSLPQAEPDWELNYM